MAWTKKSKYGNKKVEFNGIKFDSIKEKNRYIELHQLQVIGVIHSLELQKKLEIIPKQKGERATHYVADFYYYDNSIFSWVIEDTKGYKTDIYRIKRKLVKLKYPDCEFRES